MGSVPAALEEGTLPEGEKCLLQGAKWNEVQNVLTSTRGVIQTRISHV